jgi:hypothetical protein
VTDPSTPASGGTGPPGNGARAGKGDLWYKVLTVVASWALVWVIYQSFHVNTLLLRQSKQSTMLANVISLDRVFIKDPSLYKYFYYGQQPGLRDTDYQKTVAAAQMFADVLDDVVESMDGEDAQTRAEWDAWITDMLAHSPALRDYLQKHSQWYNPQFAQRLARVVPAAPEAPGADAHGAPRPPAPAAGVRR